ncbi:MAG: hypothetical protein R6V26_01195 [Roseovarius sp.]
MIAKWRLAAGLIGVAGLAAAQDVAEQFNDYPTEARADYVFACMATNGQGADILRRCSCSIDEIAAIVPYEKYLQAETVLSMRRASGERMSYFKSAPTAENFVADVRRAQAEAEIVCF